MSAEPDDGLADAKAAATRAFKRRMGTLRRAGAVGEVGVGVNPALGPHLQWWARCQTNDGGVARSWLVEHHGSGLDALEALADTIAARPRPDRRSLWTPGMN